MTSSLNARLLFVLLAALVLTIIPLPDAIASFRPPWVLLIVLYVQLFLPQYFRVTLVFLLGLSLDVLLSTTLGEHAFALLLTSSLAAGRSRRFIFFSIVQQMLLLAVFCLVYQLVLYLIDASFGYNITLSGASVAAFIGVLFWPWLRLFADNALL